MNKREQIQQEALDTAIKHIRSTSALSVGVGKTLVGLNYIEHWYKQNQFLRVLLVSPKLSIIKGWKDEMIKFNKEYLNNIIESTTYLSLNKKNPNDYDVVILEEAHNLLNGHRSFLNRFRGRILGLTGTPPRYANSEKGKMVSEFCPVKYEYLTDDAVDDDILNDYQIIVHCMPLSTAKTFLVKTKTKSFYASESDNYGYWSTKLDEAQTKKQQQILSIMRMRALMEYKTKEVYARALADEIPLKKIIFCNTQEQADNMCTYTYHSKNKASEVNLVKFKNDEMDEMACVLQLNEGINIPGLEVGIILHAYGNERKAKQRIGRLLRLNPKEKSTIHILCYKNTVDEKWTREALKDLNQEKIKWFDV